MPHVILDDRAIISVSGPETRAFLQGLVTNDIGGLTTSTPLYAALLTPQGKVLFDFLMFEREGSLLIDCAREFRDGLVKRLSMYRLRAKVSIETRDDLAIAVEWGMPQRELPHDPRLSALGGRGIVPRNGKVSTENLYLDHRLRLGVPESRDFGSDRMFALDADLEELHAVAFDKGCYVGQELTARMKHRGTARKRLLPVESKTAELPSVDAELIAGGRGIGNITSRYGNRGFALVRLDRLEEAGDDRVEAESTEIVVRRPQWLFLESAA
jgi:tRNA-modifying protein YgfZ